ncbi:MAG: outer membrane protein assembly factor BamD [Crocinitomix sp.]|nr:outer membrane protein assembly factor BamD [Crocinitomix sp.]
MNLKITSLFALILTVFVMGSCSDYYKMVKENSKATPEEKKVAALEYYEKEDYVRAVTLLEQIIPFYKLTSEGAGLYFKYCMANYKLGDYYLSGYYFKRFIRQYPTSKNTEEALFLSSLCSVENSPQFSLDQTETYNALDQLQIFIDQYPNSSRIDTCNNIMDDLRAKLELKQFEYAQLYYQTENYKSAVVALEQTLVKYPESNYKEDIYYLLVKSNFELAINSVPTKKLERLNNTIKSYRNFVAAFPESSKLGELSSIKKQTDKAISDIEGNN